MPLSPRNRKNPRLREYKTVTHNSGVADSRNLEKAGRLMLSGFFVSCIRKSPIEIRDQSGSDFLRGHSSVGRAPALQAGCQGFESPCLQSPQGVRQESTTAGPHSSDGREPIPLPPFFRKRKNAMPKAWRRRLDRVSPYQATSLSSARRDSNRGRGPGSL